MPPSVEDGNKSEAMPQHSVPKATLRETLGIIAEVVVPNLAKGVIIRRPRAVAMAERLGLDRRAIRRLQQLRDKYGTGPLLLRVPARSQALILSPDHVRQVLEHSPEPFATASLEKRAALAHFEPKGVLVSHGAERADRRRFNEQVLGSDSPVHRLGERFAEVVDEEARQLLEEVGRNNGNLTWNDFAPAWFRVVRRVVLGDAAADDHELTDMMAELRAAANWVGLRRRRTKLRERFHARLSEHLARAEQGSLAGIMARIPTTQKTAPAQQPPQWLFAFDPAGMTTFRALALLASHPRHAERAREEIRRVGQARQHLPYLRACVLESLRLWPTTPMVLRESTHKTTWETGVMPMNTSILIFAPFFHRDDRRLPAADRFSPEIWLQEPTTQPSPLIPFSGGPAICPRRHLVLLLSSTMLAALLDGRQVRLQPPNRLQEDEPLPATLNNYSLRFALKGW
jgi:cytochrome P450